ncbi:proton-coupled folate transporter-like isoform X2 [Thrips palmi]|uniref:Proton-coupled folate transporter-like isoform X2 n=1 Tax=Thrips palmi TaxID=161013 RepID=A0A6P8ZYC1_THRPL|nr:proton-coupled folate transporter-like isoform X2 [Thrips palmi]
MKRAEAAAVAEEGREAEAAASGDGGKQAEAAVREGHGPGAEDVNGEEAEDVRADAATLAEEEAVLRQDEGDDVPTEQAEQERLYSGANGGVEKPSLPAEKFDFWALPLRAKLRYIRKNVTVEPMLAMFTIPSVLASLATQNLNLEKACRVNLRYDDVVCDALTARMTANYTLEETEVQKLTATMAGWKAFIQSSLPALLLLFVGSWSDRHGRRKPCMLLPIVGELLTSLGLLVCTYFFHELPLEAATFTEGVFPAMTGGWTTMLMAVFTYTADVTTEAERTFRVGIVNLCFCLGIPIGMALSGVAYRLIGFYGVFSLSASMYVCSFWWGYTQVAEEPRKWAGDGPPPHGVLGFLKDFFDVRRLLETVRVVFKKGENNRLVKVVLLMLVVMMVIGPMHGEHTVLYLFLRLRFNWDELNFSFFETYTVVVNLVGTMLAVGVLSAVLKIEDSLIGIMSCASKILAGFIYAFATTVGVLLIV